MRLEVKVTTKGDPLNIRSGAGTSYKITGSLPKGTQIIVNKQTNGWYQLEDKRGWISSTYTTIVKNLETSTTPKKVTTPNPQATTTGKISTANSTGKSNGIDAKLLDMLKAEVKRSGNKLNSSNTSTRLFGCPFQFTKTTDFRPDSNFDMGRNYLENIISEAPIVYFIPGKPSYLPELSKEERAGLTEFFQGKGEGDNKSIIDSIIKNNKDIRYFDFITDYAEYIKYVNLLCRMSAVYIGIGDVKVPWSNKTYKYYDWGNYKFQNDYKEPSSSKEKKSLFDLKDIVEDMSETLFGQYKYIQFYVEPNTSFSESSSNQTQQSKMAGMFDSAEGIIKELAFLTNTAAVSSLNEAEAAFSKSMGEISQKMVKNGKENFFSRLLGMSSTVLSGSNIIFPDLWGSSEFNKSYTITMNFVSPYGDKESIFLNVIVPLMHVLALALPRQTTANSYMSPFLVKVFAKGWFSCELGIIDNINIDKGGDGAWNVDGLPSEMKVSISVKDLYSNLMITPATKAKLFFQNQGLIDFLAVTCGVDITKPNFLVKLETMFSVFFNKPLDLPANAYRDFIQGIRSKIEPIFRL